VQKRYFLNQNYADPRTKFQLEFLGCEVMILGVYGNSKSGKTTLIETLIPKLIAKDYKVGTIKHICKDNFTIDSENEDTGRHAKAGARLIIAASGSETAIVLKNKKNLDEIINLISKLDNVDIILVEGFKKTDIPKIMVGEITEEKNTIFKCESNNDNMDEIVMYIQKTIDLERQLKLLPGLDCGKCGFNCSEFARLLLEKNKNLEDCHYYSEKYVTIRYNDKKIALGKFAKQIISNTILGMVSSLKGTDEIKELNKLEIHLKS
jgi:molybdopterin-guanine dinucleotide biosynthesis protein B